MQHHQQIKNRFLYTLFLIIVSILSLILSLTASAQEETLNFYVTPEFPDTQREGEKNYFNIVLEPDESEILVLTLQNATQEELTIDITPHTAYTNVHGVVEYGKDAQDPDSTLIHSLDSLIETPDEITLAGLETKTVHLALQMPDEEFEGMLAGGLRIAEVTSDTEKEDQGEGVAIKNEFAYVLGVIISNDPSAIQGDIDLLDVYADQLNYRNVMSATIQNFTATFINHLEIDAKIRRQGETEILYQANKEKMQMAPNSHMHFPISLEGDRFRSGEYILSLTARSGEEEWAWERSFTIDAEEARALNRSDVTIDSAINWWMIAAIALIILLILAVLIFVKNRNKFQPDE